MSCVTCFAFFKAGRYFIWPQLKPWPWFTQSILSIPLLKCLDLGPQQAEAQLVGYSSLPAHFCFTTEAIYLPRGHLCLFPNLFMSVVVVTVLRKNLKSEKSKSQEKQANNQMNCFYTVKRKSPKTFCGWLSHGRDNCERGKKNDKMRKDFVRFCRDF